MSDREEAVEFYGSYYEKFASEPYAGIRREAFGEDIGQNGWLTRDEQDLFLRWLELDAGSRLLDVACGSGGPTLRIAERTGCSVTGVDIEAPALAAARAAAGDRGLGERARFERVDASGRLPFADAAFDGVVCVDAINHLEDRQAVLREWHRVLRPGGRLVFTDPIIVTGPLTGEEMRIRSSIGFFLFVPAGTDEAMLASAGFEVEHAEDRTENMAATAEAWRSARAARADGLCGLEGKETFEGRQRFLEITSLLAAERRLSRTAFCARKRT